MESIECYMEHLKLNCIIKITWREEKLDPVRTPFVSLKCLEKSASNLENTLPNWAIRYTAFTNKDTFIQHYTWTQDSKTQRPGEQVFQEVHQTIIAK